MVTVRIDILRKVLDEFTDRGVEVPVEMLGFGDGLRVLFRVGEIAPGQRELHWSPQPRLPVQFIWLKFRETSTTTLAIRSFQVCATADTVADHQPSRRVRCPGDRVSRHHRARKILRTLDRCPRWGAMISRPADPVGWTSSCHVGPLLDDIRVLVKNITVARQADYFSSKCRAVQRDQSPRSPSALTMAVRTYRRAQPMSRMWRGCGSGSSTRR